MKTFVLISKATNLEVARTDSNSVSRAFGILLEMVGVPSLSVEANDYKVVGTHWASYAAPQNNESETEQDVDAMATTHTHNHDKATEEERPASVPVDLTEWKREQEVANKRNVGKSWAGKSEAQKRYEVRLDQEEEEMYKALAQLE